MKANQLPAPPPVCTPPVFPEGTRVKTHDDPLEGTVKASGINGSTWVMVAWDGGTQPPKHPFLCFRDGVEKV